MAGQVSYAYTCKFCNRNPCACTAEICNVTKPLDPKGIATALAEMKAEAEPSPPAATVQDISDSPTDTSPSGPVPGDGGSRLDLLIDDDLPARTPSQGTQRPALDAP
jgi:hypothetical protein